MRSIDKAALGLAAWALPAAASASDTVNYTYDALGRLTDIAVTGGLNDGSAAATRYDPAGNRTSYGVSGTGATAPAGASQSASSLDAAESTAETAAEEADPADLPIAEEVPAVPVDPPAGIPEESEPVVNVEVPERGQ
jgi:hypothetical protein